MSGPAPHRVVIVGGGFGGLYAARSMRRMPVEVTLIDRRNFHLFQPLLYQVATGGLSPANIAAPLRSLLKRQKNARVIMGEVTGFDVAGREVVLADGTRVGYDNLVVAAGSTHHYFGHPEWEKLAPGLKTVEDATEIRRRVLSAFEAAERSPDPQQQRRLLTFVVVGAGPTGVEMAGAISELARHTLRRDFRRIDPARARILLVEGVDRVLPPFPEKLSRRAQEALEGMGVEVWTNSLVTDLQPEYVLIKRDGREERAETHTVVWAAGVKASPLGKALAEATGCELDRAGRVIVEEDLTVPGHPEIFVIGDLASAKYPDGKTPLPGVAPVAMQQGRYVAGVIDKRLRGRTVHRFRYWDKGTMATIGRARAVVDLYWLRFSGFFAWLTWLFVHILYLVQFQNRLLVLTQWA
ncbi:MAG TPA: NAD(P)/FAD-dependent oxidoreductase, partial [Gemmataceae bacterium]